MSASNPSPTDSAADPQGSMAAQALDAAGDAVQAHDVAALDDAAAGAAKRLGAAKKSLVQRLIYGPQPAPAELASGAAGGDELDAAGKAVVDAAIGCMADGRAFQADAKLSGALRKAVADEKGYGFTVPVEFGGAAASYGAFARVEEELAANGLGALAVEISGELTIGAGSLLAYGTDAQKKTYLPMIAEGRLMAFGLTEVGVGVNAKKVAAYVELDEESNCWRLHAADERSKMYITNATHGAIVGLVARIGKTGRKVGLFVTELPEQDVIKDRDGDHGFSCRSTEVSAFVANHNARLSFDNYPIPRKNQIEADGVEVLFYCLRMGRCMLAAMSAGYQRMLAADAVNYARQRDGVGGRVIRHELPRLNLGKILGGALQARALSHLSLQQDADGVDLAGLRDLTKSAASGTALESMVACEHVLGGRTFHSGTRTSDARANIHVFGIVEGEDDLILMGMVKDLTTEFTDNHMAGMLGVIRSINVDAAGKPLPKDELILRIGPKELLKHPGRCVTATGRLLANKSFWGLVGWIAKNGTLDLLRASGRLIPTSFLPRYARLPKILRAPARYAERQLRFSKWTYLGVNLWFQLELTRAQIPLQRFGKGVEHLTSMVAVCWHAGQRDATQQRTAALQASLLRGKFESLRILSGLIEMERLRGLVAAVGEDLEAERTTLLAGLAPEPFAAPWEGLSEQPVDAAPEARSA